MPDPPDAISTAKRTTAKEESLARVAAAKAAAKACRDAQDAEERLRQLALNTADEIMRGN